MSSIAKRRVRQIVTAIGARNHGKSTTVRTHVDRYPDDVLIYSTLGDKAFDSYLRVLPDLETFDKARQRIAQYRNQPLLPGVFTPIFGHALNPHHKDENGQPLPYMEPVSLLLRNKYLLTGYVAGFSPDGRYAQLWINHHEDVLDFGELKFDLPPNRTIGQRIMLSPIWVPVHEVTQTTRLLKVQVPAEWVPFWNISERRPSMSRYFPKMANMLFVISDASPLLAEGRTYNRDLHQIVTTCRHKGVDLYLIVHELAELQVQQFRLSNYIVLHKQDTNPAIPRHLERYLPVAKRAELLEMLQRIESHPNPYYYEVFENANPGEDVIVEM